MTMDSQTQYAQLTEVFHDVFDDDSIVVTWPGAPERCDGVFNDCLSRGGALSAPTDETDDYPGGGDGYVECTLSGEWLGSGSVVGGGDCADTDARAWTTCETCADHDADDWWAGCDAYPAADGPDCDDQHAAVYPGALELCDGLHDDCDGWTGTPHLDVDGEFVDA